jgi:hypothetical protein
MWEPYRQSLEQWVPQCQIIYDKFPENKFHLLLVNAHHVKQVPGRKTDQKDSDISTQDIYALDVDFP